MHFSTLASLIFFLVLSLVANYVINQKFPTQKLKSQK